MHGFAQQLGSGQLTVATIAFWTTVSILLSIVGGALAGMTLAGKDLGHSLAAMVGALFGPVAAGPGILVGLIVLSLI